MVEAADLILNSLSDADDTRSVEASAGHNWREDFSIQEAMDMRREAELRRFSRRN